MSQVAKQVNKCKFLFLNTKGIVTTNQYPTVESVFNRLMEADPDNGLNCFWLMKQYKNKQFDINDISSVYNTLSIFFENRISLPESKRSLESYTYKDLLNINKRWSNIIDINTDICVNDEYTKCDPNIKVIYDGKYGRLTVPLTMESSCKLGSGTKWCTAATESTNMFGKYSDSGPLYIWYDNISKKKYQFSFAHENEYGVKGEFKDSSNSDINTDLLNHFKYEHPILKQLFEQEQDKDKLKPEYLYNYAIYLNRRVPEAEHYIMKDPEYALLYAKNIIKGRWIEAEPYIFENNDYTVSYMESLSSSDRKSLESTILRSPSLSYLYAKNILYDRWSDAESIIIKDPESAYSYAKNILKGRWYEAEPYIMKDPYSAYLYAERIIGGRWIQAEPYIMKDPIYAFKYATDILGTRWIEAEPYLSKNKDIYEMYKIYFDI